MKVTLNGKEIKPSERIKQIMSEMAVSKGDNWLDHRIGAIWEYLDEQFEERQKENDPITSSV